MKYLIALLVAASLSACGGQPIKPTEPDIITRTESCVAPTGKPSEPLFNSTISLQNMSSHDYVIAVTSDMLTARLYANDLAAAVAGCR